MAAGNQRPRSSVDQRVGVGSAELFQSAADAVESLIHGVGELQDAVFAAGDSAGAKHFAPVEHAIPVAASINQDQVAAIEFSCLHQGQHLPQFGHGAESAGKYNQRLGQLCEPQFAHEEVVELETQLGADIGVGPLLVR